MRHITTSLLAALLFTFAGCSTSEDIGNGVEMVSMPIHLSIPATGFEDVTRTPGDPGTYEKFLLPEYAYIYLYTENATKVGNVVYKKLTLNKENWTKAIYGGDGDSIYTYTGTAEINIPTEREVGRVYVAALGGGGDFDNGGEKDHFDNENATPTTEEGIKERKFYFRGNLVRDNLQNLYSSPCELKNKEINDEKVYYGTIEDIKSKTPSVNMLLYHVAAKVDIQWNVATNEQRNVRLSLMDAEKLQQTDCFLFMPMKTEYTDDGYDVSVVDKFTPANQWSGRKCIYAIPAINKKDGKYYIRLRLQQNDDTKVSPAEGYQNYGYNMAITPEQESMNDVYTPWFRATINIKNKLVYNNHLAPIPPEKGSTE